MRDFDITQKVSVIIKHHLFVYFLALQQLGDTVLFLLIHYGLNAVEQKKKYYFDDAGKFTWLVITISVNPSS